MVSAFNRIIQAWRRIGGFTILELLAVFAILAVIAALVAPKYTTVVHESKIKACKSNVEMLTKAAEMYHEVKGEWPSEQQLVDGKYIGKYVYCPVNDKEDDTTAYNIDADLGVVTCKNCDQPAEP